MFLAMISTGIQLQNILRVKISVKSYQNKQLHSVCLHYQLGRNSNLFLLCGCALGTAMWIYQLISRRTTKIYQQLWDGLRLASLEKIH